MTAASHDQIESQSIAGDTNDCDATQGRMRTPFQRLALGAAACFPPAWHIVMAASLLLAEVALQDGARAEDVLGVTSDEIRIGSFGAFAGQGYLFGRLTMNGIDAVFHQVNADGGIYGRRLILIREDDRCDPETAVAATRTLVSVHKAFALLGGGCSNATLAARPEIEMAQIPFINVASVADAISNPVSKYIYATQLTAAIESEAQLQYAIDHDAKKIDSSATRRLGTSRLRSAGCRLQKAQSSPGYRPPNRPGRDGWLATSP
jgi:ABC-type branched-subunit amino acid transport system substrate-binding protein